MEQNKEKKHGVVQTYAQDMAQVLEDDKGGLIKKIIQGEEKHEEEKRNLSPESKKNKFFMLISVLFIALGLATLFFFILTKEVPTVPIEKQFTPLIFNDTSASVEVAGLGRDKIIQSVFNIVNATKVKAGGVEGIYLLNNKKDIGLREFLILLKANFTPGDNTFFIKDHFLMGVVNGGTKDFFILLKARSIADIFDALGVWENKMFSDLYGFFGEDISLETKYLLSANFTDGIIENKNARILYDKNNKIAMMYIFANDNSVIITNTESAAQEIMLRLAASQIKK
ncbi:MAG: hypothetical protein AAB595_01035 [Patescibacteria group bacterium]